jgi:hypothetical protein
VARGGEGGGGGGGGGGGAAAAAAVAVVVVVRLYQAGWSFVWWWDFVAPTRKNHALGERASERFRARSGQGRR